MKYVFTREDLIEFIERVADDVDGGARMHPELYLKDLKVMEDE